MDEISNLIPEKYIGAVVVALAVLRLLDGIIRAIPDDYLKAHTTFQMVVNAFKAVVAWATKKAPSATTIAILFLSCAAFADEPPPAPAPIQGPVVAPVPSPPVVVTPAPAASPPTLAEVAICTAQTLPGTVGKCAGLPSSPKLDDRSFYTALFGTIGTSVTVLGGLLTLYLSPSPVGK